MKKEILSALIGLVGAVNNNGKTEKTDEVVRKALVGDDAKALVELIHKEKFSISPNCESCQSPCGNTSDYSMERFDEWPDKQRELKEKTLEETKRIAGKLSEGQDLPDIVYRVIACAGYDLEDESYIKLLEDLKLW